MLRAGFRPYYLIIARNCETHLISVSSYFKGDLFLCQQRENESEFERPKNDEREGNKEEGK